MVYICYSCKSPQQYHGIHVIIIITVVHVNRFICLTYGEHSCHSQGRETEPRSSHRSRWLQNSCSFLHVMEAPSEVRQMLKLHQTIRYNPHNFPLPCLCYSIRISSHTPNPFLPSDLYLQDQLKWPPGFSPQPSTPPQVRIRDSLLPTLMVGRNGLCLYSGFFIPSLLLTVYTSNSTYQF